jgi:FAD/FMN-containing dehydrogenase/ferredoxin
MSWTEYLIYRLRKTASKRSRLYGIDPPPFVKGLLAQEEPALNFSETCRLLSYVLFKSPQRRLVLLWQFLTDQDTPMRRRRIESLANDLKPRLSELCHIATTFFVRRNYSRDLAHIPSLMEKMLYRTTPHLVIQPKNENDIAEVLSFCKSRGLAVFPRGSGSSAFGGPIPTRNGIVLDLSPLKAILEVNPEKQTLRVQPGARWADVAVKLGSYGLSPVTTPTSYFSTIGGWISTGGMGLGSYAYGPVFESVAGVRVARPDGTLEKMESKSTSIKDLFGTEGQFGILTEITLRVRPKPSYSGTFLVTFDSPDKALEFIDKLSTRDIHPSHVAFFDQEYMKRENILFSKQTKLDDSIVSEKDTVFLHFETPDSEQKFISSLNGKEKEVSKNRIAARSLWSERYFPLKAQRLGPGLLGSEVVIPRSQASRYVAKVRKIARNFQVKPSIEVIVCRNEHGFSYLVIVSFACDYSISLHYAISLLFNQMLVRLAVRLGGHPYGIGIWNTPFVKSKYDRGQAEKLKNKKHMMDPEGTLNPNKFFKIKGRFFSVPALMLRPIIFRTILALANFFAPGIGLIARITKPKQFDHWDIQENKEIQDKNFLHQSALRCTSCGSCVSVCPAYHFTLDELVTGRTKLRMAEAIMNGGKLETSDAHAPFQCLHCGLCEEVCQTHLPLRECYHVLEDWIEDQYGSPDETVRKFVDKLDSNRAFIKEIFGLDLPEWNSDEQFSRVPALERPAQGGRK